MYVSIDKLDLRAILPSRAKGQPFFKRKKGRRRRPTAYSLLFKYVTRSGHNRLDFNAPSTPWYPLVLHRGISKYRHYRYLISPTHQPPFLYRSDLWGRQYRGCNCTLAQCCNLKPQLRRKKLLLNFKCKLTIAAHCRLYVWRPLRNGRCKPRFHGFQLMPLECPCPKLNPRSIVVNKFLPNP